MLMSKIHVVVIYRTTQLYIFISGMVGHSKPRPQNYDLNRKIILNALSLFSVLSYYINHYYISDQGKAARVLHETFVHYVHCLRDRERHCIIRITMQNYSYKRNVHNLLYQYTWDGNLIFIQYNYRHTNNTTHSFEIYT